MKDMKALNKTVTQAVERVFESHLKSLTYKGNQLKQSEGLIEADPTDLGSSAKGKGLGSSPYWGDEPLCSPLNFKFLQTRQALIPPFL